VDPPAGVRAAGDEMALSVPLQTAGAAAPTNENGTTRCQAGTNITMKPECLERRDRSAQITLPDGSGPVSEASLPRR
jgi:hypothetical protein